MVNLWFILAVLVGLLARAYDGKIISIAVGLCVGVLLNELWKFLVWMLK